MLLIDTDPQPSLYSLYYPVDSSVLKALGSVGLTNLLTSTDAPLPARTSILNFDIILSDNPSSTLEFTLLHATDGRLRITQTLNRIKGYNFTLIDKRS